MVMQAFLTSQGQCLKSYLHFFICPHNRLLFKPCVRVAVPRELRIIQG